MSLHLRWVELSIVLVIISILAMLGYPVYLDYARKSARTDVQRALLDWARSQREWRENHISFNDGIYPLNNNRYAFTMSNATTVSLTLTATAKGKQLGDEEDGTSCSTMSVDQSGSVRTPPACWSL